MYNYTSEHMAHTLSASICIALQSIQSDMAEQCSGTFDMFGPTQIHHHLSLAEYFKAGKRDLTVVSL